jgi:hypothetical protein
MHQKKKLGEIKMKRLHIPMTIFALLVFPQVALGADDVEADIQAIKDIVEQGGCN